ncbi:HCLS1-associated protein X-1-like [Megalops cyprinoides]|uniref:HCLS1-associated protein X-1-like n=1 Tax=Megalops cyprinoides TaxID=118141 RepID=UPI001863E864|nr:HCLS1-associated protein X-1-like [Megalops cyprinoides]
MMTLMTMMVIPMIMVVTEYSRTPLMRHGDIPSIDFPLPQASPEQGERGASGNSLRDFMLKSPDSSLPPPSSPSVTPGAPRDEGIPSSRSPTCPFHHWSAFIKISEMWREGFWKSEEEKTKGEDGDVGSRFPLESQDQTPSPSKSQPKTKSVFTSVTVTRVVRPDGTVEERRTVRDSQGNEETTVTRSGGPGDSRQPREQLGPGAPAKKSE